MSVAETHIEQERQPHRHGGADMCCHEERVPVSPVEGSREQSAAGLTFVIHGLDCAEEVATLRRAVGPLTGAEDRLSFDILNGRMSVAGGKAAVSSIIAAVAKTGMRAELYRLNDKPTARPDSRQRTQTIFTIASGLSVLAGFTLHAAMTGSLAGALHEGGGTQMPLAALAAYSLAIVLGGRFVAAKAWHAALRLRPDMNLLMTIAVAGAIGIGDWLEAATVTFLFALSLTLEAWSVGRARNAIAALLDLAPSTARVVDESGTERDVPAAEVEPDERFIVKPGERIALDGVVISGQSAVNQAPITGESLPVLKEMGAEVFAGTINGDGVLTVRSTKRAEDTTLAQIIRMVEAAQLRRSTSERWVETFAKYYTPAVIAMAATVAIIPPLLFGAGWAAWFYNALVLLVIACPCALVISTPVSIVAALASAARAGVLIKGGAYLEIPARLKAIAFDKTGTLTAGRPAVLAVEPLNGHTEEALLARAASLEARSTHPLARAILEQAAKAGVEPAPAEDVQILPGKGVRGVFEGREFWLGSHRYLEERAQESSLLHTRAEYYEQQGRTVVAIGNEAHVCGLIAIADSIRPEAAQAIQALRTAGLERLVMLTGDNDATARHIAGQTGIGDVRSELLPADKVAAVERLVSEYGTVAMIGDGVNDAPAMASASLGIAMGAAGSDAAIEAADIALMGDDLSKLPWLVAHSRRTLGIIRQNVIFALGVKLAFMALAIVGLASLWGAIAADVGASLLVVMNGLRLVRTPELAIVNPNTPELRESYVQGEAG